MCTNLNNLELGIMVSIFVRVNPRLGSIRIESILVFTCMLHCPGWNCSNEKIKIKLYLIRIIRCSIFLAWFEACTQQEPRILFQGKMLVSNLKGGNCCFIKLWVKDSDLAIRYSNNISRVHKHERDLNPNLLFKSFNVSQILLIFGLRTHFFYNL